MTARVLLPALTSILALVFASPCSTSGGSGAAASSSSGRSGMLFYGIAAGAEAIAGVGGWNEALYRAWYLTGAVWTAGWLGLGTAFLLGRTRFGYTFALCLLLAGLFTLLIRNRPEYAGRRHAAAAVLHRGRRPGPGHRRRDVLPERALAALAAGAVVGATILASCSWRRRRPAAPGLRRRPGDRHAGRDAASRRTSGC